MYEILINLSKHFTWYLTVYLWYIHQRQFHFGLLYDVTRWEIQQRDGWIINFIIHYSARIATTPVCIEDA